MLVVRRGQDTIAFHRGLAISWPARSGKPVYSRPQTRLYPGERYRVRLVPRTHKLARAFLAANQDTRFYE